MSYLMSPKLIHLGLSIWFHCPGCNTLHPYQVNPEAKGPKWQFNGDVEKPTFTPSLLVDKDRPERRCHLFLTDGRIQYLSDCFHTLAGQTVDLPDIPDVESWLGGEAD
jgi:hypothetical protein